MSTQDRPKVPSNILSLTGPPLMGIMLNWGLFGTLTIQVYIYSQHFPNDRKWIKWMVYSLYVLEMAQTILASSDAFQWFAVGFGNMESLSKPFNSSIDSPIMDGIIALVVQLFFCWRIKILSEHRVLSGVICLFALTQAAGALAVGIRSKEINNVLQMKSSTAFAVLWYASSALADTLISVAMTILLLRNASNNLQGGHVLRRIVRLIIETNSLTASVAIVGFATFVALPNTSIFMVPAMTIGKLYTNTLMAVFNNRVFLTLNDARGDSVSTRSRFNLTSCPPQAISLSRMTSDTSHGDQVKIEIGVETQVITDKGVNEIVAQGSNLESDSGHAV